jgi:hypothetical protein
MAKTKTEQVRLPVELMKDVRFAAAALEEQPNAYVARVVREALRRDLPKAQRTLAKRIADQGAEGGEARP